MRKARSFLTILCVFFAVAIPFAQGRLWVDQPIVLSGSTYIDTGISPSLVLLYGVQPVVSTYNYSTPTEAKVVHRTPLGWVDYSAYVSPGYVAGNGSRTIISNSRPVNYGQDGKFYSYIRYSTAVVPTFYGEGTWLPAGPSFLFHDDIAGVTATFEGRIYMGSWTTLAQLSGSTWMEPTDPEQTSGWWGTWFPIDRVSQVAVSPFGQVAVSGYGSSNEKLVVWYDFKSSAWYSRTLPGEDATRQAVIGIGWDKKGNLGVAYSDNNIGPAQQILFDYLDLINDVWTREKVLDNATAPFKGAAIAFDRFDRPVIVSGTHLVYDPVPEPTTLLFFAWAVIAGPGIFKRP